MKTKSIFLLFVFSICFINFSFSQENKSKICFIRAPRHYGAEIRFNIFIDKKLVCKIHNNRYSIHEIEPGEHNFAIQAVGEELDAGAIKRSKTINVTAGKNFYFIINTASTGMGVQLLSFEEIMESSYKRSVKDLELENECL